MKRKHNIVNSLYIQPEESEELNLRLQMRYNMIKEQEQRYEIINPRQI
jgi:2-oxoglutarate ferredoxin oxidoreductase subunit alpha